MVSIKQLKAEISNAAYFNPEQKRWLLAGIDKAEHHLAQARRAPEFKIRNPKKASGLMPLDAWESARGKELHFTDLEAWAKSHTLDELSLRTMIEEFRTDMLSKGKQYANFILTFQTYLRRGYLSKNMDQCRSKTHTVIETKGINL